MSRKCPLRDTFLACITSISFLYYSNMPGKSHSFVFNKIVIQCSLSQRRIWDPVKHLRRSFSQKSLMTMTVDYFPKKLYHRCSTGFKRRLCHNLLVLSHWLQLKVRQCRFKNIPICSWSYKNNILKISHSYSSVCNF